MVRTVAEIEAEERSSGGLRYAPLHEMIHAGQIGFLRRLLGKVAVR